MSSRSRHLICPSSGVYIKRGDSNFLKINPQGCSRLWCEQKHHFRTELPGVSNETHFSDITSSGSRRIDLFTERSLFFSPHKPYFNELEQIYTLHEGWFCHCLCNSISQYKQSPYSDKVKVRKLRISDGSVCLWLIKQIEYPSNQSGLYWKLLQNNFSCKADLRHSMQLKAPQ